jgi:hypothetical protein
MVSAAATVSAHRLDEYLQTARLGVEADRVDLDLALTPGVAVAGAILSAIDRDGDGVLSPDERAAYAAEVLGAINIAIDGDPLRPRSIDTAFPDRQALQRGDGTIRLRAVVELPPLSIGRHRLLFRNNHRRDVSVYLANALVPATDRVGVTDQLRDAGQHELTIEYVLREEPKWSLPVWLLTALGGGALAAAGLVAAAVSKRYGAQPLSSARRAQEP